MNDVDRVVSPLGQAKKTPGDVTLSGVVKTTYLRGQKVWDDGRAIGDPVGEWIRR